MLSWTPSWFPADPARLAKLEIVLAVLLALLGAATAVVGFLLWKVTDYKGDIEKRLTQEQLAATRMMLSEAEQRAARELAQTRAELADAQHRAEELEARQAPRRLTPEQARAIRGGLTKKPETPVVVSDMLGDPESEQYAKELSTAIRQADWPVDVRHSKFEPQPRGLIIQVRSLEAAPRAAGTLLDALRRAGLEVEVAQNQGVTEAVTLLIVGHKPEPSASGRTTK